MNKEETMRDQFARACEYPRDKTVRFPTILLVDGCAGIYAYDELISRYTVLVFAGKVEGGETYRTLERYLRDEARSNPEDKPRLIETVFHPDNEDYLENIYDLEDDLYVKGEDGVYYLVTSIDGDIFAVHPDAEYDEKSETYYLP